MKEMLCRAGRFAHIPVTPNLHCRPMAYLMFFERYTLASLAVLVLIVPVLLGGVRYSYFDKAFRLLYAFLCLDLLIGLWMMHLAVNRTNNILLANVLVPIRYTLLSGMFIYYFGSARSRRAVLYVLMGFVPFVFLDIYTSNPTLTDLHHHRAGRFSQVVESILMIMWVLLYFYEVIKSLAVTNIVSFPFFWVCAGLLIFYSGNIFFFPFWYFMNQWENDLQLGIIEQIPYGIEIISLILFSIGIGLTRSQYGILKS
jgi:hypothetical protein